MGLWERLHKDDIAVVTDDGPTIAEAVDTAKAAQRETWGRPGRCGRCGGNGYLDHIDMIDRIMYEHCPECGHKWSVTQAETQPAI